MCRRRWLPSLGAMSIASVIIDPLLHLDGPAAYALVGILAFAEAAVLVGFVLPGETAVILGGVLAYRHSVSLPVMMLVVVIAAIVGDTVGYEVGKRYGDRVLNLAIFDRHRAGVEAGRSRVLAIGGRAVLLARFTAFLRAVMPGIAGTVKMRYRTFLVWNAAGGLIWGVGFTLLGYLAGASYQRIEGYAGRFSEVVLAAAVVVALGWWIRRRRQEPPPAADDADIGAAQTSTSP